MTETETPNPENPENPESPENTANAGDTADTADTASTQNAQSTETAAGTASIAATEHIERHSYDVVVIGAGGAGLRAAIEARQAGKRVAIISKSLFGKAHTV